MNPSEPGVSVVICCHNAAQRLPVTMEHLSKQVVPDGIAWEVLVVDNGSTDGTAEVALQAWTGDPQKLRVVPESRPGLIYARIKGFQTSRYEFVSFVDDDNWVCRNWVHTVYDVMTASPQTGVCCGFNEAHCEIPAPGWFSTCCGAYAVSTVDTEFGDITNSAQLPFGAGMTIRRGTWDFLAARGFEFILTGRLGNRIVSGEDWELCTAIRQAGWRLWREPALKLVHFMEARRLTWAYCRKLYRAGGASYVGHDIYRIAMEPKPANLLGRLRETWQWQLWYVFQQLLAAPRRLWNAIVSSREGDPDVLWLESRLGRISMLLGWRSEFRRNVRRVRAAQWRR